MFYVYREAASTGARELAKALEGKRALTPRQLGKMRKEDVLVCWGTPSAHPQGGKVLNGTANVSKLTELRLLREAKVPVVEFTPYTAGTPVPAGWLGRSRNHQEGSDLFNPPARPDFLVRQEQFVKEFRIHSFQGRSIRAGVKALRAEFTGVGEVRHPWTPGDHRGLAHPWIRNWTGGYRISYDGKSVKQAYRDVAHAAVKALGLDFGAVDLGVTADKRIIVLEVNRAAGIEGGTIAAYANAVQEWHQNQ